MHPNFQRLPIGEVIRLTPAEQYTYWRKVFDEDIDTDKSSAYYACERIRELYLHPYYPLADDHDPERPHEHWSIVSRDMLLEGGFEIW